MSCVGYYLKAAKALGLTVSDKLLVAADVVIQIESCSLQCMSQVLACAVKKAALSSGCKAHPAKRSSRKQPEQSWR